MDPDLITLFPTHVGMNRRSTWPDAPLISVPHARGDEPFIAALGLLEYDCSPRTWG